MASIATLEKNIFRLLFVVVIIFITYSNRWIFSFRFEPEYWENYYYESQWNVPNSKRGISDEGVYRYIGYRLVNGENPFNVDYWVPPLGKYWYGVGAKFLGNPYLISFIYYLISIYVFWLIDKTIIPSERVRRLTLLLFAINPLLVEQMGQTMLDLPMTLFFMLTILFLLKSVEAKETKYGVLAGMSLGLMAGIKPPYFVPMIMMVGLIWLYKNKVKNWWYFLPMILLGYLLAYSCYFVAHPNPIPFIRLHEKVINFQKNNGGNHDLLNIFRTIFLAKYKGHWVGAELIQPENWSAVLPIGFTGLVFLIFNFRKVIKKNKKIILLVILGGDIHCNAFNNRLLAKIFADAYTNNYFSYRFYVSEKYIFTVGNKFISNTLIVNDVISNP